MPDIPGQLTDGVITLRPYRLDDLDETYRAVRESLDALMPWMSWAHSNYSISETRAYLERVTQAWETGNADSILRDGGHK